MEPQCFLCRKTVKEIAEEELAGISIGRKSINVRLDDSLCYPYLLCNSCEDFLRLLIPKMLEAEGIIEFDGKLERYVVKQA